MTIKTALIGGGSGSGKTLIANLFRSSYVLSMDNYYKGPFKTLKGGIPDWDNPESVDFDTWISDYHHIWHAISTGSDVTINKYNFKTRKHSKAIFRGKEHQCKWIVLEGLFALDKRMIDLADIRIFVEAPFNIRVSRRLKRDVVERRSDLMFILNHSYYTEMCYRKHIEPSKKYADMVVPNFES